MSPTAPTLEVNSLYGGYGRYDVLKDLAIQVADGESVAVLGPNGAGKTTLLYAIMGLLKHRRGSIRIGGEEVSKLPSYRIGQGRAAIVPAGRRLFLDQSVESNLIIGAYHLRRDKRRVQELMESVYALFPVLQEFSTRQASDLSGGQQQMVAIGRMLMGDPRLLVLDEPSLGLAPLAVEIVAKALRQLREQGRSILLVEQRVELALETCDRFYVLVGGEVVLEDKPSSVDSDRRVLIEAFLG
jgi:branched-chain amino acid transport system ATP-binding protein